jgi:hypothetical protein
MTPPDGISISDLPMLTPDILQLAFEENPLNAQLVYDKQWIKLRGTLAAGPVKADLKGLAQYNLMLEHNNKQVACVFFGQAKEQQLAQLKKGQSLVVVGRYAPKAPAPTLTFCTILDGEH